MSDNLKTYIGIGVGVAAAAGLGYMAWKSVNGERQALKEKVKRAEQAALAFAFLSTRCVQKLRAKTQMIKETNEVVQTQTQTITTLKDQVKAHTSGTESLIHLSEQLDAQLRGLENSATN